MTVVPITSWPDADPASPFFCHGPTLVSFSGGRTSAYMLWCIVCAHGGVLPDYVYVAFANTGREREETLRFVYDVGVWLGVKIWWVEWRPAPRYKAPKCAHQRKGRCAACRADNLIEAAGQRFEIVGLNSADRTGKWFSELIRRKQYLPNIDMRYCTEKLKVETMKWFMVSRGFATWFNMVGLRADERPRVMKQVIRNAQGKERWVSGAPLFVAGVIERMVLAFWLGRNVDPRNLTHPLPQGFDLGLRSYEGNCDLCFLKGRGKRARLVRDFPWIPIWWQEQEDLSTARTGIRTSYMKRFDMHESVADLIAAVEAQVEIDLGDGADREVDCTGDVCGIDEGATNDDFDAGAVEWMADQLRRVAAAPPPAMTARRAAPAVVRDLFAELQHEAA